MSPLWAVNPLSLSMCSSLSFWLLNQAPFCVKHLPLLTDLCWGQRSKLGTGSAVTQLVKNAVPPSTNMFSVTAGCCGAAGWWTAAWLKLIVNKSNHKEPEWKWLHMKGMLLQVGATKSSLTNCWNAYQLQRRQAAVCKTNLIFTTMTTAAVSYTEESSTRKQLPFLKISIQLHIFFNQFIVGSYFTRFLFYFICIFKACSFRNIKGCCGKSVKLFKLTFS